VHSNRLLHRHAPDAVRPSCLPVGSHERVAVNTSPQHVQTAQQGPQALLSCSASQEYLVKDEERSMVGHGRKALVPDILSSPEHGPRRHRVVRFEHESRPRIPALAGESLDQDVYAEREPQPRKYFLQGPRDRGLPRAGAAVQHNHLGHDASQYRDIL
jgi:hypothetical protein